MSLRGGTAWGVLVAQLWATGLSGIAHAREAADAPVRIESTQHERCAVLHDPSTCALCSHSHTQAVVATQAVAVPLPLPNVSWVATTALFARVLPQHAAAPPRGPPAVAV